MTQWEYCIWVSRLQNHPHVIFAARDRGGKHGCANGMEVDYSGRGRARRQRGAARTFHTMLDDMVLPADVNRDLFKGFREVDLEDEVVAEGDDAEDEGYESYEEADADGEDDEAGKKKTTKKEEDKDQLIDEQKKSKREKKRRRKLMRLKRNIQGMTKFIELALVLDKSMVAKFSRRPNYTREDIVHDALQIANIADLTWKEANQATIVPKDIGETLRNFHEYTARTLGEEFPSGQMGMAVPHTLCSVKAVGIAVEMNVYEPHLLGGIDWHGCIMAQSIIGLNHVLPYKFSECSAKEYMDVLRLGEAMCLLNKPNEIPATGATCGNRIVEGPGEDCDCGTVDECQDDKCCDPITCKFAANAECARGPCCTSDCKLRGPEQVCRESAGECDLPEFCTGEFSICPTNVYKKNGSPCGKTIHQVSTSFCFNGTCPVRDFQCAKIWGEDSVSSDTECYEHFNVKGSENGHCGTAKDGLLRPCDKQNVLCGSLHCTGGEKKPIGEETEHSSIVTTMKGRETTCKTLHDSRGLVQDGTGCGENFICLNQTCQSIYPHIDKDNCPSNHASKECSGNGVCTNQNRCYCTPEYAGPDCSIQVPDPVYRIPQATTTEEPSTTTPKFDLSSKMTQKETPYDDKASNHVSTLSMVVTLVSMVFGVFLCFASVAVYCYRYATALTHWCKSINQCLFKNTNPTLSL
ncbi:hypothetical protein FOCC_FOCC017648 [Frankliniella occidentalis]|nr:hypothetical protein FOCC_FOCC017648 [Frankliniella occidentalis]